MPNMKFNRLVSYSAFGLFLGAGQCMAMAQTDAQLQALVDAAVTPVMQQQSVPGMAIALTVNGKAHYFNYGVASRENQQAVTRDTLFEIGSGDGLLVFPGGDAVIKVMRLAVDG